MRCRSNFKLVMSWARDQWKADLPHKALQKVEELENQADRLKKDVQQRQNQIENLKSMMEKQKQTAESDRIDAADQKRDSRRLADQCETLEKAKRKALQEVQQRDARLVGVQDQFQKARGALEEENAQKQRLKADLDRVQRQLADAKRQAENFQIQAQKADAFERKLAESQAQVLKESRTSQRTEQRLQEQINMGEQQRRKLELALEESKEKFQRLQDSSGSNVKDLKSRLQHVTSEAEKGKKAWDQLECLKRSHTMLEEGKKSVDQQIGEMKKKLDQKMAELDDSDVRKGELSGELNASKAQMANLESEMAELKKKHDSVKEECGKLEVQVNLKAAENFSNIEKIQELEMTLLNLGQEKDELKAALDRMQTDVDSADDGRKEAVKMADIAVGNLKDLQSKEASTDELEKMADEIFEKNDLIKVLQSEKESLIVQAEEFERRMKEMRDEVIEKEEEVKKAGFQLEAVQLDLEEMTDCQQSAEERAQRLEEALESGKERMVGVESEGKRLLSELESMVNAVNGEKERLDVLKADLVRVSEEGRMAKELVEKMEVKGAESREEADAVRKGLEEKVKELEDECEGSRRALAALECEMECALKELGGQVDAERTGKAALEVLVTQKDAELEDVGFRLDEAQVDVEARQDEIQSLRGSLKEWSDSLANVKREKAEEVDVLMVKMENLQSCLRLEKASLEEALAGALAREGVLKGSLKAVKDGFVEAEVRASEEREKVDGELRRLREECEGYERALCGVKEEMEAKLRETGRQVDCEKDARSLMSEKLAEKDGELGMVRMQLEEATDAVDAKQGEVDSARNELRKLEEEIVSYKRECSVEMEGLRGEVSHGRDALEAEKVRTGEELASALRREESLRRDLQSKEEKLVDIQMKADEDRKNLEMTVERLLGECEEMGRGLAGVKEELVEKLKEMGSQVDDERKARALVIEQMDEKENDWKDLLGRLKEAECLVDAKQGEVESVRKVMKELEGRLAEMMNESAVEVKLLREEMETLGGALSEEKADLEDELASALAREELLRGDIQCRDEKFVEAEVKCKEEREQLELQVKSLLDECDGHESALNGVKEEMAAQLEELGRKVDDEKKVKDALVREMAEKDDQLTNAGVNLQQMEATVEAKEKEIDLVRTALKEMEGQLGESKMASSVEMEALRGEMEKVNEALNAEKIGLGNDLAAAVAREESLKGDLKCKEKKLIDIERQLSEEREEMEERLKHLVDECDGRESGVAAVKEEMEVKLTELGSQVDCERKAKVSLMEEMAERDGRLRELLVRLDEAKAAVEAKQGDVDRLTTALKGMEETMAEKRKEFDVDVEGLRDEVESVREGLSAEKVGLERDLEAALGREELLKRDVELRDDALIQADVKAGEERTKVEVELKRLQEECEGREKEVDAVSKEMSALLTELGSQVDCERKAKELLIEEIDEKDGRLRDMSVKLDDAQTALEAKQEELDSVKTALRELERKAAERKSESAGEIESLRNEMESVKDALNADIIRLKQEMAEDSAKQEILLGNLQSTEAKLVDVEVKTREEKQKLELVLESLQEECEGCEKEVDAVNKEMSARLTELGSQVDCERKAKELLIEEMDERDGRLRDLSVKLDEAQAALEAKQEEMDSVKTAMGELERKAAERKSESAGEIESLTKEMESVKDALNADIIRLKQEMAEESAKQEILLGNLQSTEAKLVDVEVKAREETQKMDLVLESLQEECEGLSDALAAQKSQFGIELKELAAQIDVKEKEKAAAVEDKMADVDDERKEKVVWMEKVGEVEDELRDVLAKLEKWQATAEAANEEVGRMKTSLKIAEDDVTEMRERSGRAEEELQSEIGRLGCVLIDAKGELKEALDREKDGRQERVELEMRMEDEVVKEKAGVEEEKRLVAQEKARLESKVEIEKEKERLVEERDDLEEKVKRMIGDKEKQEETLDKLIAKLREVNEETEREKEGLKMQLIDACAKRDAQRRSYEEKKAELEKENGQAVKDLQNRLTRLQEEYSVQEDLIQYKEKEFGSVRDELEAKINRLAKEVKEKSDEVEQMKRETSDLEVALRLTEGELEKVDGRCAQLEKMAEKGKSSGIPVPVTTPTPLKGRQTTNEKPKASGIPVLVATPTPCEKIKASGIPVSATTPTFFKRRRRTPRKGSSLASTPQRIPVKKALPSPLPLEEPSSPPFKSTRSRRARIVGRCKTPVACTDDVKKSVHWADRPFDGDKSPADLQTVKYLTPSPSGDSPFTSFLKSLPGKKRPLSSVENSGSSCNPVDSVCKKTRSSGVVDSEENRVGLKYSDFSDLNEKPDCKTQ